MQTNRKRILVGLSGGVDSSVSAALLLRQGYHVTGAFIKTWQPEGVPCDWREERRMAMRVAAHLRIPFLTVDLSEEYKRLVIDAMVEGYRVGEIPNPDVLCNRDVKFGSFLDFALAHGFDGIATGHYAKIERGRVGWRLLRGADRKKDQGYFLWTLGQRELSRTLFPVGGFRKDHVRLIAAQLRLPNAAKRDSQGLCFVGPMDVHEFLRRELTCAPGEVQDTSGAVIGEHDGAVLYAIGQRHGFRLYPGAPSVPLYVVRKDISKNVIIVTPAKDELIYRGKIHIGYIHEIRPGAISGRGMSFEYRYHGPVTPIRSIVSTATELSIEPSRPITGLSAGQSVVIYRKNEILGGGILLAS
jgi:tRNA-specific 2-thiouridylase